MYPLTYGPFMLVSSNRDMDEADEILKQCVLTHFMVAVDVETTGLETKDHKLVCVTFSTPDQAIIVPTARVTGFMKHILSHPYYKILIHNGSFDWSYIREYLDTEVTNIIDTKRLAVMAGYKGRETSLKHLCNVILSVALDKSYATTFKEGEDITEEQAAYTAVDALVLWPLYIQLIHKALPAVILPLEDLRAMIDYLEGQGPWPQHGEYVSLKPSPNSCDHRWRHIKPTYSVRVTARQCIYCKYVEYADPEDETKFYPPTL